MGGRVLVAVAAGRRSLVAYRRADGSIRYLFIPAAAIQEMIELGEMNLRVRSLLIGALAQIPVFLYFRLNESQLGHLYSAAFTDFLASALGGYFSVPAQNWNVLRGFLLLSFSVAALFSAFPTQDTKLIPPPMFFLDVLLRTSLIPFWTGFLATKAINGSLRR